MHKKIFAIALSVVLTTGLTGTVSASEPDMETYSEVFLEEDASEKALHEDSLEETVSTDQPQPADEQSSQEDVIMPDTQTEEPLDDTSPTEKNVDSVSDEDDWDDWDDEDDYDYDYDWFELSHESLSLTIGSGRKLVLYDDVYDPLPGDSKGLSWSTSNQKVAKVSSTGYVTALSPGSATITASFNGHSWSCEVLVKKPTLSSTKATLVCNNTLQLKVKDYKGTVKWESGNRNIATVSNEGTVVAKKPGTVKITANAGGYTLACTITVPQPKLDTEKATLGFKKSLILTLYNYNGKAKWTSSNQKIATVNSSGMVTTKTSAGKVTITATVGEEEYKCIVTVKAPVLSKKKATLGFNEFLTLTLFDYDGYEYNGTAKWTSSNPKIATVNSSGMVTTKTKAGKVTITATVGEEEYKCVVTVKAPVLSMRKKATLGFNESLTLTLIDYDGYEYNGIAKWTSSNPKIATVNSRGKVTTKTKAGKVTITATVGEKKYKCIVTVKAPVLSKKKATLGFKESLILTLFDHDGYEYNGKAKWTSSNQKIATVNSSGKVTAKKKEGKVTITAAVGGKKYKCIVIVRDNTWDNVITTYKQCTVKQDTVWYVDRRYKSTNKKDVVIHPFNVQYSDGMIFSFFPQAKTTFAIFNSKGKKVWQKTISKEKHYTINLKMGKYQLKSFTNNNQEYSNGYSFRAVRSTAEFLPIELGHFYMNSAGGIEPEVLILNNTGNTIKYINFRAEFFNRVFDPVYYWDRSYQDYQIIGPMQPWYCGWFSFDASFYNNAVYYMYVGSAEIVFMDGSSMIVPVNKTYKKR